jgi:membrane protease YdiL (CAAX protease family)
MRKLPTEQEIVAFVRSVLPSSPAHWLLLLGSTLLFVSRDVRWWPPDLLFAEGLRTWALSARAVAWTFVAAGAAGYYLAFLGRERTAKWLLPWTLFASLATFVGIVALAYFYLPPSGKQSPSVLDPANNRVLPHLDAVLLGLSKITGFEIAVSGLALLALFYFLLCFKRVSVPATINAITSVSLASDAVLDDADHRRTMRFVWIMIGLFPITWILTICEASFIEAISSKLRLGPYLLTWLRSYNVLDLVFFVGLVAFAVGKQGLGGLRENFRVPEVKYALLAAIYPIAIVFVWPLLSYAHARILWATHQWSKIYAPALPNYFNTIMLSSFIYLPSIVVEEIAWRGYLQPRFIRRYGTIRGIFFVGIVWGAFYFSGYNDGGALHVTWRLIMRLLGTCVLSYTLAWLTIRSKSILPAIVTHELYDVTLSLPARGHHAPEWFFLLLWGVLGYVLFQFYSTGAEHPVTEPVEPATA